MMLHKQRNWPLAAGRSHPPDTLGHVRHVVPVDGAVMECPRCQQGDVQVHRLRSTGDLFQVRDECDASWLPSDEPTGGRFLQLFETFDRMGLRSRWAVSDHR